LRWTLGVLVVCVGLLTGCGPTGGPMTGEQAGRAAVVEAQVVEAVVPVVGEVVSDSIGVAAERLPRKPPASCPVTRPPDPPFVPPAPYLEKAPYEGDFWYGTAALWTMLGEEGSWEQLPYYDGAYSQKTVWWREGYDWRAEPEPRLQVSGRRLDLEGPSFMSDHATNGYHDDFKAFMLVGVEIPSPGCWEITGEVKGARLRYVVWVAP
jgi:hypothetical protein